MRELSIFPLSRRGVLLSKKVDFAQVLEYLSGR